MKWEWVLITPEMAKAFWKNRKRLKKNSDFRLTADMRLKEQQNMQSR